jgi:hypothetical protein
MGVARVLFSLSASFLVMRSSELKRRARKRELLISFEMKEVLERLLGESEFEFVFTHPGHPDRPLGPWVLETHASEVRKKIPHPSRCRLQCNAPHLPHGSRRVHRSGLRCSTWRGTITSRQRCATSTLRLTPFRTCLSSWQIRIARNASRSIARFAKTGAAANSQRRLGA